MAALRKNWVTTTGGLLMVVGALPEGVQFAHLPYPLPLWWNSCQFPLFLCFLLGAGLIGWAAKGADEHSTLPQSEAATAKAAVENVSAKVEANPAEMPAVPVVIVHPDKKD